MSTHHRQSGLSLVELMVSLTIGLILIGGALYVYIEGSQTAKVNEQVARMQENARFALKQLEEDIQLAGFWGLHQDTSGIAGRAQTGLAADYNVANDCDAGWAARLRNHIDGVESDDPGWNCIDDGIRVDNTDILVVRRADDEPVDDLDLDEGRLYMEVSVDGRGQIFAGAASPNTLPPEAQNFPLVANAYYVATQDVVGFEDPIPVLRSTRLDVNGNVAAMVDREIVQGVEDFQIQFGIDTAATGNVELYVDADNPLLAAPGTTVRAVRLWLLMRTMTPELGVSDSQTYLLGSQEFEAPGDAFRRLVVSRTVSVRNRLIAP